MTTKYGYNIMKYFNVKSFTLTSALLFASQVTAELPHFLWDNQDGVVSMENCSIKRIRKHDFRLSRFYGRGNKPTENLRNYSGVLQSHLINSSMVKITEGKSKRSYEHIEVVGINTNTSAKSNRWFSERGDKGYLYNESLVPLEDFVFDMNLSQTKLKESFANENFEGSVTGVDLSKNIYLRIAADSSYYGLSCEGASDRDYLIFRAYQKDQGDRPLFLMGVSSEETAIFKSFSAIEKTTAMKFLADVGNEEPLMEGMIQSNVMASRIGDVESVESEKDVETEVQEALETIPRPQARPENLVVTKSLQKIVCIGTRSLNVRSESLDKVLFRAKLGEEVKVFQDWNAKEVKKVINGTEHTFRKVSFPNREESDQNIGYVADSFVKSEDDCRFIDNGNIVRGPETQITGIDDVRCCDFPTVQKPTHSYSSGMRKFGAGRSKGRTHAACDLYRYKDEPIKSVAPGKVISNLYYFYEGTYALEVLHSGGFVVRYGELTGYKATGVRRNSRVKMGQKIGKMGKVNSNCCRPMLHFELYSGKRTGSLTRESGRYRRRSDLMNPTSYLNKWADGVF